jgi:hypothetical protein
MKSNIPAESNPSNQNNIHWDDSNPMNAHIIYNTIKKTNIILLPVIGPPSVILRYTLYIVVIFETTSNSHTSGKIAIK